MDSSLQDLLQDQETLQSLIPMLTGLGLRLIGALAVLIGGRWLAGRLRNSLKRGVERSQLDDSLAPFLSGMAYYVTLAVVVIAFLGLFGIQTASLIAVLGTAGLAVGLSLQGTLSNFASGVMLLIFRPFTAGHYVEVAGYAGSVSEIGIFTTTLNTPDNVKILVPNSAIFGAAIKNYSANDTRRNDLVMSISYADDIGAAIESIRRRLESEERVLKEPATVIAVGELADSSVNLLVRPWCRKEDYWPLRFDLTRALKQDLESAGCSIPFPQRDVHLSGNGASSPS